MVLRRYERTSQLSNARIQRCAHDFSNFYPDVFGIVIAGQSNMALPLMFTFSRNISRDAILAGKYSNIRIHGMAGNMNPEQPWSTLKDALSKIVAS